jgi:putative ABC transport system substrate-binding protein
MRRRELLLLLGGAMTAGHGLRAQQRATPVIGQLSLFSPPANPRDLVRGPIRQGISEMGFIEGQNMIWEYRWADLHYDRLPALAADLVSLKVDLIVTRGGTNPALAAKNATSTIPIIFTDVGDPVGLGLVASLARPGGNLTGFSTLTVELDPKRLDLLCELVPRAAVIALLVNPGNEMAEHHIRTTQEAARVKGIKLVVLKATSEPEIEAAFTALKQPQAGGLLVANASLFSTRRAQLVALAARDAVPVIYSQSEFVSAGGLISYATDIDVLYRQAGIYTGKILKGAKPADLPVQQPTTFELVVNLKTAKALGLTVPPSILARADEVIE